MVGDTRRKEEYMKAEESRRECGRLCVHPTRVNEIAIEARTLTILDQEVLCGVLQKYTHTTHNNSRSEVSVQ